MHARVYACVYVCMLSDYDGDDDCFCAGTDCLCRAVFLRLNSCQVDRIGLYDLKFCAVLPLYHHR